MTERSTDVEAHVAAAAVIQNQTVLRLSQTHVSTEVQGLPLKTEGMVIFYRF